MSDFLKHECGIAIVRLRKPLSYYQDKYGTSFWGFQKLFLLMEKQHNRGHDGAGIGGIKINQPMGLSYMFRHRNAEENCLSKIFKKELAHINELKELGIITKPNETTADPELIKRNYDFGGEILMGHLRYGTSGAFNETSCHPYTRRSNWSTRTLMVMGNFNMTNTTELNQKLINRGQHPVFDTDTQTVLEEIGYYLDETHTDLYRKLKDEGIEGRKIPALISEELSIADVIQQAAEAWDGGYAIAGAVGNGDLFVTRDPHGIRPCHYYIDDEVIAVASERVPLMTVFSVQKEEIKELNPGGIMTVDHNGAIDFKQILQAAEKKSCSFESIYFSRGNDPKIYKERKILGAGLAPQIIEAVDGNFEDMVVSFIPNTAETAYYGLMDGLREHRRMEVKRDMLAAVEQGEVTDKLLDELILKNWPRGEKIAHKDIKLRTFISQQKDRERLVSHVYDITYDVVTQKDTLVVLDDSIVRGTTLRESIINILSRTNPKKIIICSTAPQIRFPDCYGIDMSELGKFVAFDAVVKMLRQNGQAALLEQVFNECQAELAKPFGQQTNPVKKLYEQFTYKEVSAKIAEILMPDLLSWKGELEIIYLDVPTLHECLGPDYGDWYFTGDYPTVGGYYVVCQAYSHWYQGYEGRSYDLFG